MFTYLLSSATYRHDFIRLYVQWWPIIACFCYKIARFADILIYYEPAIDLLKRFCSEHYTCLYGNLIPASTMFHRTAVRDMFFCGQAFCQATPCLKSTVLFTIHCTVMSVLIAAWKRHGCLFPTVPAVFVWLCFAPVTGCRLGVTSCVMWNVITDP